MSASAPDLIPHLAGMADHGIAGLGDHRARPLDPRRALYVRVLKARPHRSGKPAVDDADGSEVAIDAPNEQMLHDRAGIVEAYISGAWSVDISRPDVSLVGPSLIKRDQDPQLDLSMLVVPDPYRIHGSFSFSFVRREGAHSAGSGRTTPSTHSATSGSEIETWLSLPYWLDRLGTFPSAEKAPPRLEPVLQRVQGLDDDLTLVADVGHEPPMLAQRVAAVRRLLTELDRQVAGLEAEVALDGRGERP